MTRRRTKLKHAFINAGLPFKAQLARGFLRGHERYVVLAGLRHGRAVDNGLPVPPAKLRVLVAGTAEVGWFLKSGRAQAAYLRELLRQTGSPLEEMGSVLDFGCGCGRIARWFADLEDTQLNGCDYNPELVAWCNASLPFLAARTTELEPPLPYADASFDFLYAFSVFTHMSAELAQRWVDELARVVRPGGLFWFTLHGDSYRDRLGEGELARFDSGEIVVWLPEIEGTNLCGAYWPRHAVERMLNGRFETVSHLDPIGDRDLAERTRVVQDACLSHDAYLARRI